MFRALVILAGLSLATAGMISRFVDKLPSSAPKTVAASAVADPAPSTSSRTIVVPRDSRGHFQVDARVDGRRMSFMVDTGASTIALTQSAAGQLGIHPAQREFTVSVRTANGSVRAAPVRLSMVEVGGLIVRDVAALVAPDEALNENLLGLSFLTKLRRFEYANGKLVLEQ